MGRVKHEGDFLRALDDEAKRLIIDCVYSGRGHQEDAKRWQWANTVLGLPAEIITALMASGAAISALLGAEPWKTAALALLAAILTAVRAFVRADELAEGHAVKGNRYITLRNEGRFFREIELRSDSDGKELASHLRELRKRYDAIGEDPPRVISRAAYERAKKNIASGESSYENDPLWKELSG